MLVVRWKKGYNLILPHSSVGYKPPVHNLTQLLEQIPEACKIVKGSMNNYRITQVVVFVIAVVPAFMSIASWLNTDLKENVILMKPGLDNPPQKTSTVTENVFGKYHKVFKDKPISNHQETWSGFRGDNRNNISPNETRLAESWSTSGPIKLWEQALGDGHAAAAIHKGFVYVLDYDEQRSMDMLRCFNLDTGDEIWQTGYSNPMKRNHGRSRSIPYVTDDCVVSLGPRGHLMAVKTDDGSFLWGKSLGAEYESEIPLWYTAQCPIVVDGKVLTAICGMDVLIEAFDCLTGETVWSIPNEVKYKMSHSSIIPVNLAGVEHFVYAALGGIVGFTADGQLLWIESWEPAVVAPSPVQTSENLLFLTAGYGVGSMILRVTSESSEWKTGKILQRAPTEGMACEQQTPLFYNGKIYGILPKDAGPHREEFCCSDEKGNLLWTSGPLTRFGLGPWVVADDKFLILKDNGELFMADASTNSWQVLDSAHVINGVDAWGPLAIAGGFLLMRDSTRLVCLDLREESYK